MSIPVSRKSESIQMAASWHAMKLLGVVACATVLCAVVGTFINQSSLIGGEAQQLVSNGCLILEIGLIAIYVSLSALWGVLGSGRWWARMAGSWVIFHLAVVISLQAAALIESSDPMSWGGNLAYFAGVSYALTGQILIFMLLTWLLKAMRWRLIYMQHPESYSHPRERLGGASERRGGTLLKNRLSLLDMLALTTLFAVYFGVWKPLFAVLPDDSFLGPGFLFVVVIYFLTICAIFTLVVFSITCVTMNDRLGNRVQAVVHGLLQCVALTIATVFYRFFVEPEQASALVLGLITLVAFQLLLYGLLRKPSRLFRFRLTRLTRSPSTKKPSCLIVGSDTKVLWCDGENR